MEENTELVQKAQSLQGRCHEVTVVNETLKSQLEECRWRFKNAMFSGGNVGN
jgi:hypothetical protein